MKNKNIDGGRAFDWGRASADYAKFRDIYPPEFFKRITDLGLCMKGQHVLDLGTGTGVLPRGLYASGAHFTGVDISPQQISQAKRLAKDHGMDIDFIVSSAEALDFPANSFDVITACQCFLYFDKALVLPKFHHMLKNGGHFCEIWVAWLPEESEIAAASEALILRYNPTWTGAAYRRPVLSPPDWASPLFTVENLLAYDVSIPFTRETWHGRIRACRGIGASSLPQKEIEAFEAEHFALLQSFPAYFEIPHHVTMQNLKVTCPE